MSPLRAKMLTLDGAARRSDRRPLVSVMMATYNCGHLIRAAIESVLSQSYRPIQLVVVDDGSTDDTAQVLAPYRDRLEYFSCVHLGEPGARNTGLSVARGAYLAFLDADDVLKADSISARVEFMESQPALDVVFGDVEVVRGAETIFPSFMAERQAFQALSRVHMGDGRYLLRGDLYDALVRERFITMPSVLIRRGFMNEIGGFDEAFTRQADYDLWLRLAKDGCFGYLDRVLARCFIHHNNLSGNKVGATQKRIELLHKQLRIYPDLSLRTRRLIRRRLREQYFELGYLHFSEGQLVEARDQFALCLRYGAWHGTAFAYYLSCVLAPETVARLRVAKRRLLARVRGPNE